jgi:hypothetical protein
MLRPLDILVIAHYFQQRAERRILIPSQREATKNETCVRFRTLDPPAIPITSANTPNSQESSGMNCSALRHLKIHEMLSL